MNDEERLEDIKKIISMWHSNIRDGDINTITLDDIEELDWLIEQAERVPKLEKGKQRLKGYAKPMKDEITKLKKENERLRESLKYIAENRSEEGSEISVRGDNMRLHEIDKLAFEHVLSELSEDEALAIGSYVGELNKQIKEYQEVLRKISTVNTSYSRIIKRYAKQMLEDI